MMLNEESWGKDWSDTFVADFCCYTEQRVTVAYCKALTGSILSQGTVQHGYKFCLHSFSLHLLTWLRIQVLFSLKPWWICIPLCTL